MSSGERRGTRQRALVNPQPPGDGRRPTTSRTRHASGVTNPAVLTEHGYVPSVLQHQDSSSQSGETSVMSRATGQRITKGTNQIYVVGKRQLFYSTVNDSCCAKFARYITCHCFAQKSELSSETIRIEEWHGCTRKLQSMDIDSVEDIQLRETFGFCLLCCGRGDIRIYGQDKDQNKEFFTCHNVENAGEVFLKVAELIHKLNDLRFGIKRPDDPKVRQVIYNSRLDGCCVKCLRVSACGCLRPTTVITKTAVTTAKWHCGCPCERVTLRLDLDMVKDVSMNQNCCEGCCLGSGRIRVFGQDKDQTDEYFDVTWVGEVKTVFRTLDTYRALLNNRDRVGFEQRRD